MDVKQKIKDTYEEMFDMPLMDDDFNKTYDGLNMDALDSVEFIMRLEAELNVLIDDDFLGDSSTINDILAYLNKITKH